MHCVRTRVAPLLGWDQLDGRRQRREVILVLGHRAEARLAVDWNRQRLRGGVENSVPALKLGAVDGEVGLVDELVRILTVARVGRDSDRDRRPYRLARRLHFEGPGRDSPSDAPSDPEPLLSTRCRKQDAELLAAEACRD